jgi:DNA-binding NtrC family response regulator
MTLSPPTPRMPHMELPPYGGPAMPEHMNEFARFVQNTVTSDAGARRPETLRAWLDLAEAYRITEALQECNGNRSAAARLLGIGRRTLYAKMEKLAITPSWRMS